MAITTKTDHPLIETKKGVPKPTDKKKSGRYPSRTRPARPPAQRR